VFEYDLCDFVEGLAMKPFSYIPSGQTVTESRGNCTLPSRRTLASLSLAFTLDDIAFTRQLATLSTSPVPNSVARH